ncbi:Protein CANDIDATE G-PROTEIN COUPLED RECEPTOR 2 [Linum perenne]
MVSAVSLPMDLHSIPNASSPSSSSAPGDPAGADAGRGGDHDSCHGIWYAALLVVPAALFVVYLGMNAAKNVKKLWRGGSYVMISYYALLWLATSLNLAWCCLQAWRCSPEKEIAWNFLSLLTASSILCLEISVIAFLLQDNYATGMGTLGRTFLVSGIIVAVDLLFKAIYVFGFRVPLFLEGPESAQRMKWGLWLIHQLLITGAYGFVLFVHFSGGKDKLPPRPAFHNYISMMFTINAMGLFACGVAALGVGFGVWLYYFMVLCYHSLYLPFVYTTFLADFFQEEDFLLDNAYYSEMKDAGFFDAEWE